MKLILLTCFYRIDKIVVAALCSILINSSIAAHNTDGMVAVYSLTSTGIASENPGNDQLKVAKSFAKLSFKKYLQRIGIEKTREIVIEIKEWSFDVSKERFSIEYDVTYEIQKDDYYGDEWIVLKKTFLLNCDVDGKNAIVSSVEEKINYIFENINSVK